jgi:hypothetical protein
MAKPVETGIVIGEHLWKVFDRKRLHRSTLRDVRG